MTKKKPGVDVKVVKLDGKADLLDFLKKLETVESREDMEALLEEVDKSVPPLDVDDEDPCDNPMCPHCMWLHGIPEREVGDRVMECVQVLTHQELVNGFTGLYGIVSTMYRDLPDDDPNMKQLGLQIAKLVAGLRKVNEKFAFATDSGQGEGAKH